MNFIYKIFTNFRFHRSSKIVPDDSLIIKNKESTQQHECCICLEPTPYYCTTNCGHVYHTGCLKKSLEYNKNCPLCRENITNYTYRKRQINLLSENNFQQENREEYPQEIIIHQNKLTRMIQKFFTNYKISDVNTFFDNIYENIKPHKYVYCLYKNILLFRILLNTIIFVTLIGLVYVYCAFMFVYFTIYGILYCLANAIDFILQ
jgi:hypothetical protein